MKFLFREGVTLADTAQRVVGDRRAGSSEGFKKIFSPQIVITLATIVFAAGILYQKVEAAERRLDRIEALLFGRPADSSAKSAGAAVDRSFLNSAIFREVNFMTPQERFNQVLIIDEPQEPKESLDAHGKEITHAVLIIRKGDETILGKYRARETTQERDKAGKLIEKTITGRRAAELACETNGWKIARN
jgi:hypothetical protein